MIRDNWSSFYTPEDVAAKITSLVPVDEEPTFIGDICAGSGNLLEAAWTRWPDAKALAIDADWRAIKSIKKKYRSLMGVCCDATDIPRVHKLIHKRIDKCNLIVANPPFGFCEKIENIYDEYLTTETLKQLLEQAHRLKRIEAYMLISNVIFLKHGGIFAALLPENLFSSEKWGEYRRIFVSDLFEKIYIGKPCKYFNKSDVKTRIFIGRLINCDNKTNSCIRKSSQETLKNVEIFRGPFVAKPIKISKKRTTPVFHTDNHESLCKNLTSKPSKLINNENAGYNKKALLRKNDIVIVRVGKKCGISSVVKEKYVGWHASDCVYVVRGPGIRSPKKLSESITNKLSSKRRGLTAMYITKMDIIKAVNSSKK